MDSYSFIVEKSEINKRIDVFCSEKILIKTRSFFQTIIKDGFVLVNNCIINKKYKLKIGDIINFTIPDLKPLTAIPEEMELDIIYEDEHLIVVNKEKGVVVHPAPGNYTGTLVSGVLYHCNELSSVNGVVRPGILHRIDKNTSGLLIIAKSDIVHLDLANQLKNHSISREYHGIVYGKYKNKSDTINLPIGRSSKDRKKMCVTDSNSKEAITHYETMSEGNGFTYVKFFLETGRTHQIRVHSSYIGNPLAGDDVYGPKNVIKDLNGQCLHAKKITFYHPIFKKQVSLNTNLPVYFKNFLKKHFI
ncbi:MAG: RluA family pseudouridine synthase [Oscillospiraceae bacterium]|nr:RluA family pseudouridine synthase [Oscillospiraceae bacterium]